MILIICDFFFHCNYVISVKRASHRQGRKNIKTLNKTKWILLTVTKHRILQTLCFELISRLSCLCEHSSFWQSIKLWNNPSSRILISAWNSLTLNHQKKKSCCQLLTAGREITFSLLTVDLSSNTEEVCDANYFFVKDNKLFLIRRVWIKPGGTAGISVHGAFLRLLITLPFFPLTSFLCFFLHSSLCDTATYYS